MTQTQRRGLKSITLLCDPIDKDMVYSVEKWEDEDEDEGAFKHQEDNLPEEHDNDRPRERV